MRRAASGDGAIRDAFAFWRARGQHRTPASLSPPRARCSNLTIVELKAVANLLGLPV